MTLSNAAVRGFKAFLLSALITPVFADEAPVFRLAAIEEAPYTPVAACFLKRLYQDMGWEMSYTALPARRALRSSSQGELDGELFRIEEVAASFPSLVIVRPPITHIKIYAFSSLPLASGAGWQRLRGLRIGYIQGYRYAERGALAGREQVGVQRPEQLISMYSKGRLDLIILDDLHALEYQQSLAAAGLMRVTPALTDIPAYHFLHEHNAQWLPLLSARLKSWAASGRRDREWDACLQRIIESAD